MPFRRRFRKIRTLLKNLLKLANAPVNEFLLNELLAQNHVHSITAERLNWAEQILLWVFQGAREQADVRFRYLLQQLEKNPEWKANFEAIVDSLLAECSFWDFFNHVGLAVERGLWGDISDRLIARFIPRGGTANFNGILITVFTDESQVAQLRVLSAPTLSGLYDLLYRPNNAELWRRRHEEVQESLRALSIHLAHHGLSSPIRARGRQLVHPSENPFVQLLNCFEEGKKDDVGQQLAACHVAVQEIRANMELSGVSVDVVNRIETISALLKRIEILFEVSRSRTREETASRTRQLVVAAVEAGIRGVSLVDYVQHHFYLLSRKISERNGQSGEHYIARTREEVNSLFRSAVGGGAVVVVMTVLKLGLIQLKPAPLFLALGIWTIYSSGFLAMQFMGFTLATKIPSFTASRLAHLLASIRRQNAEAFRSEFRFTLKSQAVGLFGNVVGLAVLVPLVGYLWNYLFPNTPLVNLHYAHHVFEDLNPFLSWAVPLGALTGVQLWLSSIAGGWFENWIVFHRIPQALEGHLRITRLFGITAAKRISTWIQKHASGLATNLALGFLFGFTPLLGALFRANWNGNHVTISSATALFSASSLNYQIDANEMWLAVLGLLLIAVMNFSLSFGLALYVAANSQKMRLSRVFYYLRTSLLMQAAR